MYFCFFPPRPYIQESYISLYCEENKTWGKIPKQSCPFQQNTDHDHKIYTGQGHQPSSGTRAKRKLTPCAPAKPQKYKSSKASNTARATLGETPSKNMGSALHDATSNCGVLMSKAGTSKGPGNLSSKKKKVKCSSYNQVQ